MHLSEREAGIFEIIGIASGCRVSHVREFALVFQPTHVQKFGRHGGIENKVSVEQSRHFSLVFSAEWKNVTHSTFLIVLYLLGTR